MMMYVSDNLWYTNNQSALSLTTLSLATVWTGLAPMLHKTGTLPAEPFNSVTNHKTSFELNLEM